MSAASEHVLNARLILKNLRNDDLIAHVRGQALTDIARDTISLTKLQRLDVSDNQLTSLNALAIPSLTTLTAHHNQIRRLIIVGEFLRSLKSLDVSYNPLTTVVALTGCANLTALIISNARLSELPVDAIKAVPRLQTLVVTHNRLTSIAAVEHLPALTALSASHNRLDNTVFRALERLSALRKLRLNGNAPLSLLPTRFSGLQLLDLLDLGNCSFASLRSVQPCQSLDRLRTLNLKGNPCCALPEYDAFCASLALSITALDSRKRSVDRVVPFKRFEAHQQQQEESSEEDSAQDIAALLSARRAPANDVDANARDDDDNGDKRSQKKRGANKSGGAAKRRAVPFSVGALSKQSNFDTW
jgi:Leucine-rich repeat (LRR) protein